MNRPNLFQIATSELSQDALIVWLLQWADKKFSQIDTQLHSCAVNFVQALLNLPNAYNVESVEAGRQWNNIDIWTQVNNEYFIVIEDKKGTKEHSDQLMRYAEIAKEHYKNTKIEIVLVYFKMEEQGEYTDIEKAGYSLFTRKKMLSVLEKYQEPDERKQNNIISDFFCYLKRLDSEINSFNTLPIDEWHWYSWKGFFAKIQKELGGNWDYVPNASGGFLGYWWHSHDKKIREMEFKIYLQLEYERLVFKLYSYEPDNRRKIRDYYRKILYRLADQQDIDIQQYGRLGQWMGIAKLKKDYRFVDDSKLINIPATIDNLRKTEKLLDSVATEIDTMKTP